MCKQRILPSIFPGISFNEDGVLNHYQRYQGEYAAVSLQKIAGDAVLPYFVTDEQFEQKELFPWNIHPLAFLPYNEDDITERIGEFGWERPNDTDPNSSNCTLNAFANQVHRIRYDFHPYVWEIANMVRTGVLTRDEGVEKIEPPEDKTMVAFSQKELELE